MRGSPRCLATETPRRHGKSSLARVVTERLLEEDGTPYVYASPRTPTTSAMLLSPHRSAQASGLARELQKAHIPTGRTEPENVSLMAVQEFGAKPRRKDQAEIPGAKGMVLCGSGRAARHRRVVSLDNNC